MYLLQVAFQLRTFFLLILSLIFSWNGEMVQLFKGIASKADTLINELQSSLHSQEEKLIAYAQQQREVYQVVFSFFQVLQPPSGRL